MEKPELWKLGGAVPETQETHGLTDQEVEKRRSIERRYESGRRGGGLVSRMIRAAGKFEVGVRGLWKNGGATDFRFRDRSFTLGRGGQRLRILHLSDLHLDLEPITGHQNEHRFSRALEEFLGGLKCRGLLDADFAVITGDIRERLDRACPHTAEVLGRVLKAIPCPVLATLGNHDRLDLVTEENLRVVRQQCQAGFRFLVNQSILLQTDKGIVEIRGVDDPHLYQTHRAGVVTSAARRILLAHSPAIARDPMAKDYQLCFSGHTHGGQVRFPGVQGGKVGFAKNGISQDMIHGWWMRGGLCGHTSSGLGCSALPVRWGCPPELCRITVEW